ncbi:MAG: putative esterase [Chthoniobacteraceae bacterium]|nr:putative esterase [Chthoniobacteraceae bacterium]
MEIPKTMPRLTFHISIPADVERQRVVIVGTDRVLGDWQPEKGLVLQRQTNGRFSGSVYVPYGLLEFKITRGSWETEESNKDGSTGLNYQYLIAHDLSLSLTVEHWADAEPWPRELIEGQAIECALDATQLGESRRVYIWLPPGYIQSSDSRHPVLYLLDGQNALHALESDEAETLRADTWVRKLAADGLIPELIIAAVFHREDFGQRDVEMSPQCDGPKLADFLVHDLKPFIDFTFCRDRVLTDPAHTGVLGFSLGASLALFMALRHSDVFGKFACLSTCYEDLSADSPDESWIIEQIRSDPDFLPDRKIYFDHGTAGGEAANEEYQTRLNAILSKKTWVEGDHFKVLRAEGTAHNLCAWRARLGAPLTFLFGAR